MSQRQKIFGVADNTTFGYFEGGEEGGERSEMLCVFYVGRRSLFDFYRIQFSVAVKQQVDFLPVGIAEEIQIGFFAGVIVRFQYFTHDKGFINAARHCAVCKRLRCQPAAEIAKKARVRKIYFWRLDDAFIDIQGERLTLMGDGNIRATERCQKADVLGKAIRICRNGRYVECDSFSEKFKASCWKRLLPLRRYLLFACRLMFTKK